MPKRRLIAGAVLIIVRSAITALAKPKNTGFGTSAFGADPFGG